MDDTCRMHVIQTSHNLIHEQLKMFPGQLLITSQNLMQVSVHELKHNVNIVEILSRHGHHDGLQIDDVFVFE